MATKAKERGAAWAEQAAAWVVAFGFMAATFAVTLVVLGVVDVLVTAAYKLLP